jgi:UPF0716 protein FxsA
LFLLLLIGVPALEVLAFVEVGLAIGWGLAIVLLLGTSLLGAALMRRRGRAAIEQVSIAISERRPPRRPGLDGALGFLGDALLIVPGFVTDALGVLLLLKPTRALIGRAVARRHGDRVMRFAATTGRFAPRGRRSRPDDVEASVVEEDRDQLGR